MAAPIGPGDWVECVASAGPDTYGNEIAAGLVYCVERIASFNDIIGNNCGEGVKLVRIGDDQCLWLPERFRPLGGNAKSLNAPPIRVRKTEDA